MIEKYFFPGVRYRWKCPGANGGVTRDGSIVNSPVVAASPMIYDGMDGELYRGGPHVSAVGLTKGMQIPYSWLVYMHGHTTRRMLSGGDVLTGFMSGCLITLWSENGIRYVGHVGTVEANPAQDTRVKDTFARAMPSQAMGFNPFAAWDPGDIANLQRTFKKGPVPKVMALVTTSGKFYSILMFGFGIGAIEEWCVGGIKSVDPMNRNTLYTALTGRAPWRRAN